MFQHRQLRNWLKVLVIMGIFSLIQIPLSQYAFGGMLQANNQALEAGDYQTQPSVTVRELNIEESPQQPSGETAKEENLNLSPEREGIVQYSNQNPKIVYLTIDDGPGMVSAAILDTLSKYDVKATFFLLEPRIRNYADMVARMANEGHRLGVHGVTHNVKRFYASRESVVQEFNQTRTALQEIVGQECFLARTPYGSSPHLTKEQHQAAAEQGYRIWDWNVDSRDWYYRSKEYVPRTLEQVERISGLGKDAVILIHELESTARWLPDLIESLLAQDYEFRVLDSSLEPICSKK